MKTGVRAAMSVLALLAFTVLAGPTPSPPSDATATRRGLVSVGTQEFGGLKTFVDGGIIADLKSGTTFNGLQIVTTTVNDGGVLLNLLPGSTIGGQSFVTTGADAGLVLQLMTGSTYNGFEFLTVVDGGYAPNVDGGYLPISSFQTTAPRTLYVDGEQGSDATECDDAGVAACKTIQSALNRVPKFVRHAITISVAGASDGGSQTYPENVTVSGFTILNVPDGGTGSGSLSISGASLVQAVLPFNNGGETGTITGYAAASGTMLPYAKLSNSMNNLATFGYFLEVTNTDGGSTRRVPMSHNDNTTTGNQYLATDFSTAPQVGDPYTIKLPPVVITGSIVILNNQGSIGFTRIYKTGVNAPTTITRSAASFTTSLFSSSAGGTMSLGSGAVDVSMTEVSVIGASTSAVLTLGGASAPVGLRFLARSQIAAPSSSPNAVPLQITNGNVVVQGAGTWSLWNNGASSFRPGVYISSVASVVLDLPRFIACSNNGALNATQHGVYANSTLGPNASVTLRMGSSFTTKGCGDGLVMDGPSSLVATGTATLGCDGATNCLVFSQGARAALPATTTLSSTNVTTDVTVDNETMPFATFNTLTPKRLVGNGGASFQSR